LKLEEKCNVWVVEIEKIAGNRADHQGLFELEHLITAIKLQEKSEEATRKVKFWSLKVNLFELCPDQCIKVENISTFSRRRDSTIAKNNLSLLIHSQSYQQESMSVILGQHEHKSELVLKTANQQEIIHLKGESIVTQLATCQAIKLSSTTQNHARFCATLRIIQPPGTEYIAVRKTSSQHEPPNTNSLDHHGRR
jgi:hypothetical protein